MLDTQLHVDTKMFYSLKKCIDFEDLSLLISCACVVLASVLMVTIPALLIAED